MTNNNVVNNLFLNQKVVQTTTNYTVLTNDVIIEVTNTAAARTITLPAPSSKNAGKFFVIKDASGGASINNIVIVPSLGSIDAAGGLVIASNYGFVQVFSDGTNYFSQSLFQGPYTGIPFAKASWSLILANPSSIGATIPGTNGTFTTLLPSSARIDLSSFTTVIPSLNLSVASPAQSITIQQSGLYLIYFSSMIATTSSANIYLQLVNNGVIIATSGIGILSTITDFIQVSMTTNLTLNSVVDIRVGTTNSGTLTFNSASCIIQQLSNVH